MTTEPQNHSTAGTRSAAPGPTSTVAPEPHASAATVLGLGSMGTAISSALQKAGHPVTVWNRTASKADPLVSVGATSAPDVATAVAASPTVFVAVSTYDDVMTVLDPVEVALGGRTVVNLTSGTPDEARDIARWLGERGARYLDGAAMSGTRLVGSPDALFLYAGSSETFTESHELLDALGRAVHLGTDPGVTAMYDTALLTVNLGLLGGFYHAAALLRAGGVDPVTFANITTDYLPFAINLIRDHADQAVAGRYPDADGSLTVYAAAVAHIVATSGQLGLNTDFPTGLHAVIDGAVTAGYGADGLARLIDVIAGGERS